MCRLPVFFLVLGLIAAVPPLVPDARAERRAFEIDDYYAIKFVGGPVVRPDGEEIVITLREYDFEAGESWSTLWRMDEDGGNLRALTTGRHHDSSPAYSPDGKHLLFVSDRNGETSQLYLMPVDGGESWALTDYALDLWDPVWSPDGRWIAVTAAVYPECGHDPDCNTELDEDRAEHPLVAHVTDELLYRHWTEWDDGKVQHVLLIDAATGEVVRDLTPGSWHAPTFSAGGGRGYDFSPDGSLLCFISNHDEDQATSTNVDLWVVTIDPTTEMSQRYALKSVAASNLTRENRGWDGAPLWSPDGRHIAYLSQATPGYESDLKRLAVVDVQSEEIRYLTGPESFDNWINDFAWSRDSRSIWFEGDVKARTTLLRYDLEKERIEECLTDGVFGGWELTPDERYVVYTRSRMGEPSEVFRARAQPGQTGKSERLTGLNDALVSEVDFRAAEEIFVPSSSGDYDIHTWIIKPHGFDPAEQYPLILNVRGGPQGTWNDRLRGDWQVYPGKGYVIALPNPTGSSGFGQQFVDDIACDWGGRVYEDLMAVTEHVAALPYVDGNRIGAMGWSYGGYMMMWMQGHTDRFRCQAAMMGLYDLRSFYSSTEELWFPEKDLCGPPWESDHYERWSPSNFVPNFKTPALVITGEKDFRVPYTQSLQYFTDLQKMDVPSRLVVFPNSGHWPGWHDMAFYYLAHLDWFHQYLGGEPPPWDLQAYLRGRAFEEEDSED